MQQAAYLPEVKEQYEHYPYPPRNPQDELKYLKAPNLECLDALNHYGFGGKRDFSKNFRVLVAGGGTGDAAIFMAEQLYGTETEIVYLDLSAASMEIAKARAAIRKLDNIKWVQGSLLDVASMNLGMFDYINSSGVLHHLENPEAGLKALESVLAPSGVIGIMVYGQYGRTAVYQMQDLMRRLAGSDTPSDKLDVCKRVLRNLPRTNWFIHSFPWLDDVKSGDAALYDLLLHSQDRAYTVPQLYEFVESAGLVLASFVGYNQYDPALYLQDPVLLEQLKDMPQRKQYALGELLCGAIKKHVIYVSREAVALPSIDDLDMVPSLSVNTDPKTYEGLHNLAKNQGDLVAYTSEKRQVRITNHPGLADILKHMDGKLTLRDIYSKAAMTSKASRGDLRTAFKLLYDAIGTNQMMFLRHKDVPQYLMVDELQARLKQRLG